MGIGLSASAKPLLEYDQLQSESGRVASHPLFLINLFSPDSPGLVGRLVTLLDKGLPVQGHGLVRFTVDGSLTAVLHSVASLAVLARVATHDERSPTPWGGLTDGQVVEAIISALSSEFGTKPPNVAARSLPPGSTTVFSGRYHMTEYRLGRSATSDSTLAGAALRLTSALGKGKIPVAYVSFPEEWRQSSGENGRSTESRWLRVGVGLQSGVEDVLASDLAALNAAKSSCSQLVKYDPLSSKQGGEMRFREICDFRGSAEDSVSEAALPRDAVDLVFTSGIARHGLVAEIVRCGGQDLLGGAMTVLAGTTLGTWTVRHGRGPEFIERLNNRCLKGLETPHLVSFTVYPTSVGNSADLWVAWRCADEPGVIRRIIQAVRQNFNDEVDLVFEISRVITTDETCAGKMHFRTPTFEDEVLERIRRTALDSIKTATQNWEPPRLDWKEEPLVVGRSEAGAEPWASLAGD